MKFIVFALIAVPGFAAFGDITITQQIEGGGPVSQMTLKVKGDKMRVDASPEVSTIIDSKSGDILNLMNSQKKYMRVSADEAKAFAAAGTDANAKERPKLTPTGKKETINGYETQEYTMNTPQYNVSYWIATNYPNASAILKQMQSMAPQAWNMNKNAMPDFSTFPGVPIRTVTKIGGREIVSTTKEIKDAPLPDSDFAAPNDFQEMKLGDLGKMLGGKSGVKAPSVAPAASPKP